MISSLSNAAVADVIPAPLRSEDNQSIRRAPTMPNIPPAPPWSADVSIPFVPIPDTINSRFRSNVSNWDTALRNKDGSYWHSKAVSIIDAINHGVHLGYSGPRSGYTVTLNHPSANTDIAQQIIDKEIIDELSIGRMAGPFTLDVIRSRLPFYRNSPMAVVPKPNSTKWRVIDDLTAGGTAAVNYHISDADSEVHYMSFNSAVKAIQRLGKGCYMGKIDWEAAFRQVAVHVDDLPLLGLSWRDQLFVRLVLPFGARSSPKLFTIFASTFKSILGRQLRIKHPNTPMELVYYLDDFFMAAESEVDCKAAMDHMISLADQLGVALHPEKRDGPSRVMQFLGIEINTINMTVRLPDNKRDLLIKACQSALDNGYASAKDLDRMIGRMGHACNVVEPGRWMLSRLQEWRNKLRPKNEHIPYTLPLAVKEDISWWISSMSVWNGHRSIFSFHDTTRAGLILQTDASSSSGAGAVLLDREGTVKAWISVPWPEGSPIRKWSSGAFELAAIIIALASFDDAISSKSVQLHSDSKVALSAMRRQSSSSALMARLMRGVSAMILSLDIHLFTSHIKGTHNIVADVASRVSLQKPTYMQLLGLHPHRRRRAVWPHWLTRLIETFSPKSGTGPSQTV